MLLIGPRPQSSNGSLPLPLPCHPGFLGLVSQRFFLIFGASIASVRIIGFVRGIPRFKTDNHGKIDLR